MAEAGDIVAIAGLAKATVADTLADPLVEEPIAAQPIDPSTIAMTFSVNDSPYAGQDGTKVTSRQIWDRLMREAEGNVAIRISRSPENDAFEVAGRGELQLAVLIETMRREGFELSISRPRVLFQNEPLTGQRLEPIEEVVIDVDEEFSGAVVEKLTKRRGELVEMRPAGAVQAAPRLPGTLTGADRLSWRFLTDTAAPGHEPDFPRLAPWKGPIAQRHTSLRQRRAGRAVAYATLELEDRGVMFIEHGTKVYSGMISASTIGQRPRGEPPEGQDLSNMRDRQGRRVCSPAGQAHPRARHRLHRRRRDGRGHQPIS
jgi:GTP-binding protein